jgi:hypothetical protein
MTAPVHSERDEAENRQLVAELRRDRMAVEADVERLEALARRQIEVPAVEAVEGMMNNLGDVLFAAAAGDDDRRLAAARRVAEAITGGRIVVSQQGRPSPRAGGSGARSRCGSCGPLCGALGWHPGRRRRGHTTVDYVDFARFSGGGTCGRREGAVGPGPAGEGDRGGTEPRPGRAVGRAMVNKALSHWFASRGLPLPDGRSRRKSLSRKGVDPDLPSKIADEVMALVEQDMLYVEIARERIACGWSRTQSLLGRHPYLAGRERMLARNSPVHVMSCASRVGR